jgi:membrane protein implicated in regulation of membrane protease activity
MKNTVIGDRLIALFLLGVLLFTPPMMAIFNVDRLVLGIPLLFLYLFGGWLIVVLLIALILRRAPDANDPDGGTSDGG